MTDSEIPCHRPLWRHGRCPPRGRQRECPSVPSRISIEAPRAVRRLADTAAARAGRAGFLPAVGSETMGFIVDGIRARPDSSSNRDPEASDKSSDNASRQRQTERDALRHRTFSDLR
jgi:hypothetical protein